MRKIEKILIGALTAVIAIVAYMIWFTRDTDDNNRPRVAAVIEVQGEAKVKSKDAIGWKFLEENHSLYESDHVFTLDHSHMKLEFYDGTILNLTPNTLLLMVKDGEKIDIDLQKGFLGLKLSDIKNQLMVRLGEKHLGLTGTGAKLHLAIDEQKSSNITVVAGEANVSYKGQEVGLKRGQKIDLAAGATKVEVTKFGIDPKLPDNEKIYFQEESTKINLAWDSENKHDSYQVIAARDPQFHDVIKNENVTTKQTSLTVKDEGHYYWKVKGMSGKRQVAEAPIATFQATREGPPVLLFPPPSEIFLVEPTQPNKSVTLRWSDAQAKKFEIEFFRYGLNSPKGEVMTAEGDYLEIPDLGVQEYKWRVRALNEQRPNAPWSDYRTFAVKEKVYEAAPGSTGPRRRQEYYDEKAGKWLRR